VSKLIAIPSLCRRSQVCYRRAVRLCAVFRFLPFVAIALSLVACGTNSTVATVSPTQNPLVAQYTITSSQSGQAVVEFGTDTTYGKSTGSYGVTQGVPFRILVAGMKPSTAYHVRAKLSANGSVVWTDRDHVFTTAALGAVPAPPIVVTRPNPSLSASENPGVELIAYSVPAGAAPTLQTFVADRDGNPIWFYAPPDGTPSFLKPMPNGHFLVAIAGTSSSIVREIDLAGNTIRQLDAATLQTNLQSLGLLPNFLFFHHDFIPLDNGHMIVLGQTTKDFADLPGYSGTTTVEGDALVDLDQNFNPAWVWSAFDHLDVNRHLMGLPDWTHSNAVVYNPDDGSLLLSIRHQSWIIGIDYRNGAGSGDILWRLGEDGDFALGGGDPSQWFYAQHFPTFVDISGSQITLSVFDNGNLRVMDASGTTCGGALAPPCYSRATIFQLDQSTMQAQVLWQYLPGFFSFWGGTSNPLPNGNLEFEMSEPFPIPQLGSRAIEVTQTDPAQIVWQMDLQGGNSYRSYRIPSLYPNVSWP
jgi:arylsulfate sulfotransferase